MIVSSVLMRRVCMVGEMRSCVVGERRGWVVGVRGVVGYGEGMADLLTVVEVW